MKFGLGWKRKWVDNQITHQLQKGWLFICRLHTCRPPHVYKHQRCMYKHSNQCGNCAAFGYIIREDDNIEQQQQQQLHIHDGQSSKPLHTDSRFQRRTFWSFDDLHHPFRMVRMRSGFVHICIYIKSLYCFCSPLIAFEEYGFD